MVTTILNIISMCDSEQYTYPYFPRVSISSNLPCFVLKLFSNKISVKTENKKMNPVEIDVINSQKVVD